MSSQLSANVSTTTTGLNVRGSEELNYNFHYINSVFDPQHEKLASQYERWQRVLVVIDTVVAGIYKDQIESYFSHYNIPVTWKLINGGELNKNMDTMLEICDAMDSFGLVRTEPVLVVGGGLVTDVAGYAAASYRRSSNFIRVPTTLIGLIDASVSIKVGLNHRGTLKNRLGAYHATLPVAQTRNGTAELIKISSVGEKRVWDLLVKNGKQLVETGYGFLPGGESVKSAGDEICKRGIEIMLQLESPNLHELGLDRVIAFGHTWSPTLELTPRIPLRHGHAITIDMAYSVTLAHARGMLSDAQRDEWFGLVTSIGLSIDHENFTPELIVAATEAIKKTRDGKQRFAVPDGEFGKCVFLNDVSNEELCSALMVHKQFVEKNFPGYQGKDAYVDAGDLGADPEAYVKSKTQKTALSAQSQTQQSLSKNDLPKVATAPHAIKVGVA